MAFDKSVWGNATWYLFHSLAHNIKETEFLSIKPDLIYVIKTVSGNLPCPECSSDAITKLEKVNFDNIKTKQEFKLLLFNFHNQVNAKLGKPGYLLTDLDEKYSKANINAIYNNFFKIYSSNVNIPQLMSASFHRRNNLPKIRTALDKIIASF
ncbi:hypothetical protein PGAG_00412 [Phaeocystis globosa virus 12T]|uniref:Uncharacterized protein n=1 Tax=Phaeocystis globosa virus PgV-16T TaxID=3071227 RepID=A0AC59EWK4_9VIRU|nr:hypothetical protein PGCG_00024 [Phaeocystis globosa virus]AET72866.1 hypothetical protein PGAG_00412 [Phaeocystis globosa virus 12T]AET73637.1 hypothetical protein PGBG_00421 [Phaeocystis globosa virus 14T]AGM15336.1 hypothetical protein PGCG_00024 [Phaeocystis globosa virus PgV-16T]UYE94066.1 Erv1/Alr family protein [Phaeocystis globosa virus]